MRIVFVVRAVNKLGGTERATIDQANLLAENTGHEVHLVSLYNDVIGNVKISPYISDKIKYHCVHNKLKLLQFGSLIHRVIDLASSRLLSKILKKINPELCVFTAIRDFRPIYTRYFKCILMVHFSYKEFLAGHYTRCKFNKCNSLFHKVVFLSSEDANQYIRETNAVNGLAINNYCRIESIIRTSYKNKKIIYVGRLDENQKKLSHAINIIKILVDSDVFEGWVFDIYGSGHSELALKKLVELNKLSEFIKFKGLSNNISEVYNNADIAILTSDFEGLPLFLIEASLKGLPIVSYNSSPGINTIVIDNENGYVVKKNDMKDFALKLTKLILNDELRSEMGKKSNKHAVRFFSKEAILKDWKKMIENYD
ncbi:TPA: glycosyltransferase [Klebsiella pneumoniae]|nr:glycosyltransferase [Klebsiella pneumoniae]